MTIRTHFVIGLGLLAVLIATPVRAETRLHYVSRYITQSTYHDHLMGVEQVSDHYALVCSNLDIVVVDLEALPADGTQTYLDRLSGLDVTNTITRPDGYGYANLRMGGFAVYHFDEASATLSFVREFSEPNVYFEKMALVGDLLYVPAHAYGLRVYSLDDPAQPALIGSINEGFADAFAVAVEGDVAYVADGAGGLKIVNIADPAAPTIVAGETVETSVGTAQDVLVHNGRVYLACGGAGIASYPMGSVEDRIVFDAPGVAKQLTMLDEYLLLASISGVHVYEMDDNGALTWIAGESGQRRSAGGDAVTLRLWNGVDAWGADRILAANWDSMDVYQLVDPSMDDQPDLTASTHRIRFAPDGGATTVRLSNDGSGELNITNITGANETFTLSPNAATIQPGEHLDLLIEYTGGQPGSTLVLVESNDPDESPLPIEVFGETEFLDPTEPALPFTLESWTFNHDAEQFEYGTFDLSACAGKVVFFQIFGVGCPACPPPIADIQNTIVGTYENDPRVVTAIVSQFDPPALLATFWSNYYLREQMLYDPSSEVGYQMYQQPYGGVPFSRGWLIGPDQNVVMPYFGYNPDGLRDAIDGLLADMSDPADIDADGTIGIGDLLMLLSAWGPCADDCPPACMGDINDDCTVDVGDLLVVLSHWDA